MSNWLASNKYPVTRIPIELEKLLRTGFIQIYDCTFFVRKFPRDEASLEVFFDLTAAEVFYNKIYLECECERRNDFPYVVSVGLLFADIVSKKLREQHYQKKYKVILSMTDELVQSCHMFFYEKRLSEADFIIDNIEKYDEATAVFD